MPFFVQTGEFSARFLLKLPVDFSNIPTYLLKVKIYNCQCENINELLRNYLTLNICMVGLPAFVRMMNSIKILIAWKFIKFLWYLGAKIVALKVILKWPFYKIKGI